MALEIELQAILDGGASEAKNWKEVSSLKFDSSSVDDTELIGMTLRVIVMHDLAGKFNITASLWAKFLTKVREMMRPNPYHNFQHICDVSQTVSSILLDEKLRTKLDDVDRFTVIIAAIMHDLDHPGMNNAYQINAGTELAIVYNDISVLENHHCSVSSRVLAECGLLDCLPRQESLSVEDRLLVLKSVLHMADISNPAKEWNVSKMWSDRVSQEFLTQGDVEKREALPVSPMCDRDSTLQDESSLGFCDFIVAPYLFQVVNLAPKVLLPACKVLAANRDIWHEMLAERLQNDEEKMKPWQTKKETFAGKFKALLDSCDI
eukprot:GSChrysophyteH1.ASY1.ANO1.826.1 assembled CDS